MNLIPQRLFGQPAVQVLMREGNTCILRKTLQQNRLDQEGYISQHVVSMVLAGEQYLRTYEGESFRIKAGEMMLLPRGIYFVSDLMGENEEFDCLLFYFDGKLVQEYLSRSEVTSLEEEPSRRFLTGSLNAALEAFAKALPRVYGNSRQGTSMVLDLKLLELMHLLGQVWDEKCWLSLLLEHSPLWQRNIRPFMEANYAKPLKIEDYAYLTGRSLSTFRREFKRQFGQSPQQWVKERRLAKAQELLQEESLSVGEVAQEVGYDNLSYFIQEFRKRVGISPKQYALGR